MTEQDWLSSEDPAAMLEHAIHRRFSGVRRQPDRPSDRKLRAFVAAAKCAHCEPRVSGMPLVDAAHYVAMASCRSLGEKAAILRDIVGNPFRPVTLPVVRAASHMSAAALESGASEEVYCPWLTPTVLSLAEAAYQERDDDGNLDDARLAVLSDSLEEAGCDNADLLRHLRGQVWLPRRVIDDQNWPEGWYPSPAAHCRGCWAVDLLLGKG